MNDLIILQTVAPDYRAKLFKYVGSKQKIESPFLYAGRCYFQKNIKTNLDSTGLELIENMFFFNRVFLFQAGMWSRVLGCKVLILEMNPRIISNWIILFLRKLLNRKTILWGHAWPIGGEASKSDIIRNLMRNLGDYIIVYTETQKKELQKKMTKKKILVAPNATFFKSEMVPIMNENPCNIIFVGRLTAKKKPFFLLKGFHKSLEMLPESTKLLIVGEGEERITIEEYIRKNKLSERVRVYGHISDYQILKELYASSLCSVSPGYIGLSVTQSFSFGVPMLVSKNENHSPEIEAVKDSFNSTFFETDDIKSFQEQILEIFNKKESWLKKRTDICNDCKEQYSIDSMGETIIKVYKNIMINDLNINKENLNIEV